MTHHEPEMFPATLGFIGGGRMAEALAAAVTAGNIVQDENLLISDPLEERRSLLAEKHGFRVTDSNLDVVDFADAIVLAVKPQRMEAVLDELRPELRKSKLFISIAAGIRIAKLFGALPGSRIIRVMPNTPCLVGEMAAGYAAGPSVTTEDLRFVESLLAAAGTAFRVDEDLLDAITGLSGSGPAFVAHLIEAFAQAGIREGIPEHIARALTLRTFSGTARLLSEFDMTTDELKQQVSSPGGTTIAGRNVLEKEPVEDIIARTVSAAAARSRELAGGAKPEEK